MKLTNNTKELLKIILGGVVILLVFLTISIAFRGDVSLDKAKFLEEFAKSLAAIAIFLLTLYVNDIHDRLKNLRKSGDLKEFIVKSIEDHKSEVEMLNNYPQLLYQNVPLLDIRKNFFLKKAYRHKLSNYNIFLAEIIKIVNTTEISIVKQNLDLLQTLTSLKLIIDDYLVDESEDKYNIVKLNLISLVTFINANRGRIQNIIKRSI